MDDDEEPRRPPRAGLPSLTKILDAGTGRELLEIDGMLPLPVGARIELGSAMDPPAQDAIVTRVRLWGAASRSSTLVLEVMLRPPGEDADLP